MTAITKLVVFPVLVFIALMLCDVSTVWAWLSCAASQLIIFAYLWIVESKKDA